MNFGSATPTRPTKLLPETLLCWMPMFKSSRGFPPVTKRVGLTASSMLFAMRTIGFQSAAHRKNQLLSPTSGRAPRFSVLSTPS